MFHAAALACALLAGQAEPTSAPEPQEASALPAPAPAAERRIAALGLGPEIALPADPGGRLVELPARLVFTMDYPAGAHLEGGVRGGLGYGQASRLPACATVDCAPLLLVEIGFVGRLRTAPTGRSAAWLGLGASGLGLDSWDLHATGFAGRVEAGLDLRAGHRVVRLQVGVVEAGYASESAGFGPGRQRSYAVGFSVIQAP